MDLTPLLTPISPAAPCGPDPEHDAMLNMEWSQFEQSVEAQHKKWSQYLYKLADEPESRPQAPGWEALQKEAFEMALKTKHLHDAAVLAECLALTEGLAGLRDGLNLIHQWCAGFWDALYPGGEPDEILDLRGNCVQHLIAPQVLARLRRIPLAATYQETKGRRHITAGPYSLDDFEAAKSSQPSAEIARLVLATFAQADQTELRTAHALGREALEQTRNLEDLFERHGGTLNLVDLRDYLSRAIAALDANLVQPSADNGEATEDGGMPGSSAASFGATGGAIASRKAAVAALDHVIAYFEAAEPSSPVPLLLRRAQRCVGKKFMEIVEELGQDRAQVEAILKPDDVSSSSGGEIDGRQRVE